MYVLGMDVYWGADGSEFSLHVSPLQSAPGTNINMSIIMSPSMLSLLSLEHDSDGDKFSGIPQEAGTKPGYRRAAPEPPQEPALPELHAAAIARHSAIGGSKRAFGRGGHVQGEARVD